MKLIITVGLLLEGAFCKENTVEVVTSRGTVRGFHVDYGSDPSQFLSGSGDIFLGIPYVLPPVDDLRFAKPIPACNYSTDGSVYDATYYRAACPQKNSCASQAQSEDCLHVNVYTPNGTATEKYPVMVWIHGGSLMYGCATDYPYSGAITNLVSRGVVVVVIQYRLGLLGFFTDGTDGFPANLGMLDQVEALRWTKDQISSFGGDPNRVTLFGQSAGSASTSAHTYSPLSQDLFQQAILESGVTLLCFEGGFGAGHLSEKRALEVCDVPPERFNSGNATDRLKRCFAEKNPEDWLKYDTMVSVDWRMQVDGYFMPDIPHKLAPFRKNIPIIYGMAHDEWTYFDMGILELGALQPENYSRPFFSLEWDYLGDMMFPYVNETKQVMEDVYAGVDADDDDYEMWIRANSAAYTSLAFSSLIQRDYQDYLARGNKNVYIYLMTYPKTINRPFDLPGFPEAVFHTAELPYVWKEEAVFVKSTDKGEVTAEDYALADWFGRTWTDFAKTGIPAENWPTTPLTGTEIYLDIDSPSPKVNTQSGFMVRDNVVHNQVFVAMTGDFHPPQMDGNPSITQQEFDAIKSSLNNEACSVLSDNKVPTIAPANPTNALPTAFTQPTPPAPDNSTTTQGVDSTTQATAHDDGFICLFILLCSLSSYT